MEFKRCAQCGETILESNEKCPYCGSTNFSCIVVKQQKDDYEKTSTGGSIGLGIFLGLFLGFLGFIIACISNGSKESGKTIIGTAIGIGIQCLLAIVISVSITALI